MKAETDFVVVYGPPASGKTLNSKAIAEVMGCDLIWEDDFSQNEIPGTAQRVLVLTSDRDKMEQITPASMMSIGEAKCLLGARWIEPKERV